MHRILQGGSVNAGMAIFDITGLIYHIAIDSHSLTKMKKLHNKYLFSKVIQSSLLMKRSTREGKYISYLEAEVLVMKKMQHISTWS